MCLERPTNSLFHKPTNSLGKGQHNSTCLTMMATPFAHFKRLLRHLQAIVGLPSSSRRLAATLSPS